ncbi:hypothetical protein U1Q18_012909 [Sarracenia purpurea var. burkii]
MLKNQNPEGGECEEVLMGLFGNGGLEESCRREVKWVAAGSKVERVKTRRVMEMRSAQMEMVDWALERRWFELALDLKMVEDDEEDDDDEEKRLVLFWLEISMDSSTSGKKTRQKPIPQPSLLFLAFAVTAIDLSFSL